MSNFRTIDRETGFLLPPSVDEWLPENHLARFVVEVVEGLDLRAMSGSYRGSGSASYHSRMLVGLVVYGYATGVFSSRKLERATYDTVAFRFIAANDHPDHDTIATFRRRFLKDIEKLFVEVLQLAREMGVLERWKHDWTGRGRRSTPTRASTARFPLKYARQARGTTEGRSRRFAGQGRGRRTIQDVPDGMSIPDELGAARGKRLRKIAEARATIEARARERHRARPGRSIEAKMAGARGRTAATGKKPGASRQRRRPKGRCRRIR